MKSCKLGHYDHHLSWSSKSTGKNFGTKLYSILCFATTMMVSGLSYGASIPSNVTIDFDSSGFSEGADHGSAVFTQGDFTITYNATNWFQDIDDGQGGSAGLFAAAFSGVETITIQTTSGNEFDFSSFYINAFGGGFAFVEGFRDAASTGTQTTGTGFGQTNGAYAVTLSSTFDNVDRVVITSNVSGFFDIFDSFVFNTVPTPTPTITSATYNTTTGALVVTGTNFTATSGASNDIVANKFIFTGEGGSTYTLTDSANVEISSATNFTLTLSATDRAAVSLIVNKNGLSSTGGTTYNLAGTAGFIADSAATADLTSNSITAAVDVPTVTSATYDASAGVLAVTGTNLKKLSGATNDIIANKFTLRGEGGSTWTLTDTANVEVSSDTSFILILSASDKAGANLILNKNGTLSSDISTYNLAAAEDWNAGADAAATIADTTGNTVTVSNVAVPAITSATYDAATGALTVTATGLLKSDGATNDIVANKFTFTGQGGATYTLTNTGNVEVASGTSFTLMLSSTDKDAVNLILNKNGTSSVGGTTYNLAAAEDWAAGADAAVVVADLTGNGITTSNAISAPDAPTIGAATAGNGQVSVAFTAPANNGGSAITGYTVTSSPGGLTGTGTASPITVTGLTNGTPYTFTVTATNAVGTSAASGASGSATPMADQTITFTNPGAQNFGTTPTLTATSSAGVGYAVSFSSATTGVCTVTTGGVLTFVTAGSCTINANQPGDAEVNAATTVSQTFTVNAIAPTAPTIGTATAGNTQATVSFTAPASNGGSTITSYTVTSNPGGFTGTGAGSPIVVTGLTNGTPYTFTITATNSAGTGAASAASNSITPAAPQTITFANPGAQNFGTTPTLTATSDSGLTPTFTSSTTGVCTITSGGALTFVTAGTCTINADQAGDSSYLPATQVSRSFTVNPVVPAAPTSPVVTAGDTQASIAFVAPLNTGGSAITSYTVTTNPADVAPLNGAASPIVVTGLTNGQAYTFTVTANNAAGTGPASAASNSITPAAIQTITFANPGAQNFGTSPTLTATSDSGLTPTFTSSTTAVCTITSGGALTFVTAGSCTINADQAGNASYLPATQVSRTFAVNAVLPGAPVIGSAAAGNSQATISFTAPASNGGTAISSYTVTSNPGNFTASGASAPLTVTGLTNGTTYTFTVTATNSAGTSAASGASNSVTPQQSNRAPTIGGAPATTVLQGNAYSFVPTAADADDDTLTFSITNMPVWASFNTSSGALTGTPSSEHVGVTAGVIISVSDGTTSAALPAFSIEVTASNAAPTISGTPAVSVNMNTAYLFEPVAEDSDSDELTFSISNKPAWASFSTSTGALSGTPQRSDVGTTQGIVISVSDGALSASLPAFNLQVVAVNEAPQAENDSFSLPFSLSGTYTLNVLANDTDPDNDSLSITFAKASIGTVLVQNNQLQLTTPENFSGVIHLSYSITDGEFNDSADVTLQIEGSNPDAPVVTVPDDLTVNATGLFTKVDVGVAMAIDRDGNRLAVALDKDSLLFSPGEHQLYWTATDAEGVSSTASQVLRVQPLVSLSKAQTVANNSKVTVDIILNGEAPSYPVEVGYSVGGSAAAGDHDLVAGTVQITSGLRASIDFNVFADLSNVSEKDVIITLSSGPNLTPNASTSVTITEANLAPTVQLTVMQQGVATSLVTLAGGPVTVKASVTDVNTGDTHSYSWQLPQNIDFTDNGDSISFAADNLSGVQQVQVEVTDSAGTTVQAADYFRVIAALPVLDTNQDTDQDGLPDALEGSGDVDGNGIPNYLDNMPSTNILPQQGSNTNAYLIECDPGVRCGLGLFARGGNSGGVQILDEEIGSIGELSLDPVFAPVGGIFDFAIRDLPTPGQSVRVVLPQRTPIPADAVYRKFQRGQWITFTQNSNNALHSAPGAPGYCPPPGSADWQPGLIAGNWCVQLTIEDGGPNDDDGLVNSAVVDPGAVAVPATDNIAPLAGDDAYSVQWNQTHQFNVLDNDTDADSDTLTIQQASANFGTVVISDDGQSLWYTPPQDFIGHAVVNYSIADGNNGSANAKANVTVYYNRPPSLTDSTASTDDKTAIEINVLANASDADGDTLSISSAAAQQGTVAITAAQTLRYTPKAGFSGTDEISVQISDGRGGTAQAKVSVTVQAVPPVVTTPEKSSGGAFNPWLLALLALSVLRRSRYNRRR